MPRKPRPRPRPKPYLAALLALLVLAPVLADAALVLDTSETVTKSDCPADGTTAPTADLSTTNTTRFYVVAESETVYLCLAATCATGGIPLPAGVPLVLDILPTRIVSCRSAGGSGDLRFVSAKFTRD